MPKRRGGKHPGARGFRSKAQWRLFFANPRLRKYARSWAHRTPGGPKIRYRRLPERKHPPGARSIRGLGKG
jgi:hypothetical protein